MAKEIDEILDGKRTIKVAGNEIELDPKKLEFNEANLSNYLEQEAIWYDYYGGCFADAEAEKDYFELKVEKLYSEKFAEAKQGGSSDKLAEAIAKADPELDTAKKNAIIAKHKMKLLQQHLKAFDRSHENANNRGHTLRKEIDKLDGRIYGDNGGVDKQIDDIIGKAEQVDD